MEDLLIQFGYVAVFLGTFLEGETILALAGLAASAEVIPPTKSVTQPTTASARRTFLTIPLLPLSVSEGNPLRARNV